MVKAEIIKDIKQQSKGEYLSDEKMNKLAAKIVKAEIMGDVKLVNELKAKLESARLYRKDNPECKEEKEDNSVVLTTTSSSGNSRPLTKSSYGGDSNSRSSKRKTETYKSGERTKFFENDDKYSLKQMVFIY